jgi:hypothetical protein
MARRAFALAASLTSVAALALTVQVWAGADLVNFPEHYAEGVKWLVSDKEGPGPKQVHEIYAPPAAIEAARKGEPMPDGTVFTVVRHAAKLDADGKPIIGPDGRYVKGEIIGFNAMEKRAGWGAEYPDALRNGEWEYRAFNADKTPNEKAKLTACFECHKPLASQDFVHAYDKLKLAVKASN